MESLSRVVLKRFPDVSLHLGDTHSALAFGISGLYGPACEGVIPALLKSG